MLPILIPDVLELLHRAMHSYTGQMISSRSWTVEGGIHPITAMHLSPILDQMCFPRSRLYDRREDEVSLDEVVRVFI